jgi:hypothetical protein
MLRTSNAPFLPARSSISCPIVLVLLLGVTPPPRDHPRGYEPETMLGGCTR